MLVKRNMILKFQVCGTHYPDIKTPCKKVLRTMQTYQYKRIMYQIILTRGIKNL